MENPAPYGNMTFTSLPIKTAQLRRERIASMMMHAILNADSPLVTNGTVVEKSPERVAKVSLAYADALIAELDKDKL